MSALSTISTISQQQYIAKQLSLASTPSGTLSLQESIKLIYSAPSPIAVYASARVLPCYSRLSSI